MCVEEWIVVIGGNAHPAKAVQKMVRSTLAMSGGACFPIKI